MTTELIARPPRRLPAGLLARLTARQLERLDPEMVQRYWPQRDPSWDTQVALERLAWEIVYWRFPYLYDALTQGEEIHPGLVPMCQVEGKTVLDAGAGAGRLSLLCAPKARRVVALEPSVRLRRLLVQKVRRLGITNIDVMPGWFDEIPLPAESIDVTVSLSAFGPDEAHGGERGLRELHRVTRRGGRLMFLWPEDPQWFLQRGYRYARFEGSLAVRFRSLATARRVARIFYPPGVLAHLEEHQRPEIPFPLLGVNPPCDACWTVNEA